MIFAATLSDRDRECVGQPSGPLLASPPTVIQIFILWSSIASVISATPNCVSCGRDPLKRTAGRIVRSHGTSERSSPKLQPQRGAPASPSLLVKKIRCDDFLRDIHQSCVQIMAQFSRSRLTWTEM